MIEMRWLIRSDWDGPEKVLQYRQLVDKTIYAQDPGGYIFPPTSKIEWSSWITVPTVKDNE